MNFVKLSLFIVIFVCGCGKNSDKDYSSNELRDLSDNSENSKDKLKEKGKELIDPSGNEIITRFLTPDGFERVQTEEGSFEFYLQHFPVKKDGSKVYLYDGSEKNREDVHAAVLNIDAGDKDLQQCADAIMRLRAEYLYNRKDFENIHFNFTNGFSADYNKWADGYRIKVSGNNVNWFLSGDKDYSYGTFKNYLEMVFSYAGTLSLSKELKNIPEKNINTGDVFIFGGSPGHAVLVIDVAEDNNKNKIFLLAQSYMPAQDIHVIKNFENPDLSPWYDLNDSDKLYTPEWTFEKTTLMRFDN